jgi:hypothetical protein
MHLQTLLRHFNNKELKDNKINILVIVQQKG